MLTQGSQLLLELAHIVVGNHGGLAHVHTCLVTQVQRTVQTLCGHCQPRLVRTAARQVDVHYELDQVPVVTPFVGSQVVAQLLAGPQVKRRRKCTAPDVHLTAAGPDVVQGRQIRRIVLCRHADQIIPGRQLACQGRHGAHVDRRSLADQPEIACTDIVEIGRLGDQIGLSQGQTAIGLLQIHAPADSCVHFLPHLLVNAFVRGIVVTGQFNELAIAQHIQPGPDSFEGLCISDGQEIEILAALAILQLPYGIQRLEPLKQVLGQIGSPALAGVMLFDARSVLAERFIDIVISDGIPDIKGGKITGPPHAHFLGSGTELMPAEPHFRIMEHGFFHRFANTGSVDDRQPRRRQSSHQYRLFQKRHCHHPPRHQTIKPIKHSRSKMDYDNFKRFQMSSSA